MYMHVCQFAFHYLLPLLQVFLCVLWQVYVQGDAIREMYRAVGLGWLVAATRVPGIKQACDMLYVKFTHYRLENALNRCDSGDSCSIKLKHLRDKLRRPKQ